MSFHHCYKYKGGFWRGRKYIELLIWIHYFSYFYKLIHLSIANIAQYFHIYTLCWYCTMYMQLLTICNRWQPYYLLCLSIVHLCHITVINMNFTNTGKQKMYYTNTSWTIIKGKHNSTEVQPRSKDQDLNHTGSNIIPIL